MKKYILLFLLVFMFTSHASAEVLVDESIYIDQPIKDSLYAFGNNVDIYSRVDGPLVIAGGTVNINEQSVIEEGGITILGDNIKIDGVLNGDVFIVGGSVYVTENAYFSDNVRITAANIHFAGNANNLNLNANKVNLVGRVRGDLFVNTKSLESNKDAYVGGSFILNTDYFYREQGRFRNGITGLDEAKPFNSALQSVKNAISLLIFGLFIIWFGSKTGKSFSRVYQYDLVRSFLIGVLAIVAIPICILVIFFTGISSILGLMLGAAFVILLLMGYFLGALRLGFEVLNRAKVAYNNVFNFMMGVFLLFVLGFIPVLGGFIALIVVLCGIGMAKKMLLNVYYGTPIFSFNKKSVNAVAKKKAAKKVTKKATKKTAKKATKKTAKKATKKTTRKTSRKK